MSLRTRLLIGYAALVLLLVLAAGGGVIGFRQVSDAAGGQLEVDVQAADRAERLVLLLDQHRHATFDAILQPDDPVVRSGVDDAASTVRDALRSIVESASAPTKGTLAPAIEDYLVAAQAALDQPERPDAERFLVAVRELDSEARAAAARYFSRNQERLVASSARVAAISRRYAVLLGALATVGLVALVFLASGLRRHVLERLDALSTFSVSIDDGQHGQRVPVDRNDELSRVAAGLNRMLDRHEELENGLRGRIAQQREVLIGLLGRVHESAVLFTPAGALVAALDPALAAPSFESVAEIARKLRREAAATGVWVDDEGRTRDLVRLTVNGRDAGWLLLPREAEAVDTSA